MERTKYLILSFYVEILHHYPSGKHKVIKGLYLECLRNIILFNTKILLGLMDYVFLGEWHIWRNWTIIGIVFEIPAGIFWRPFSSFLWILIAINTNLSILNKSLKKKKKKKDRGYVNFFNNWKPQGGGEKVCFKYYL